VTTVLSRCFRLIDKISKNFLPLLHLLIFCCSSAFTQAHSTGGLRGQIEQISRTAKGRVGVAMTLLETGESLSLNGKEHFPMQSVYKFPIAMAVLQQVDAGKLKLEQMVSVEKSDFVTPYQRSPIRDRYPQGVKLSVKELLRYMVSESDGTACDVLLWVVGGAPVVMQYLRGLGVNGVIVETTEKVMGHDQTAQYRNWAAPEEMLLLLNRFSSGKGLSASSRQLLMQHMIVTPTGLKRLKGLLPAGTIVAHKTGTSGTSEGMTAATNDVGIITLPDGRHLAIAVFVSDARASEAEREGVIARIARAAWDYWSSKRR